ncbi:EAL domain-containing protein [Shewanella aestuarii]|uniref:EAL domain-containing protein n=1 Tax=Shewanella aestuarii TaxID=1028752 RepID=A0A6G9QNW0_9GAMM|nr:EAL domain-containing protein [Shewanella aestuarii]QIR15737.1 EAL domain-containing protein [Shewanella aestuarii]
MERIKYGLIFLITLLLSVALLRFTDHILAKQLIGRDAAMLTDKFERLIKTSAAQLNALPDITFDSFECNDEVEAQLKRTVFDASFIRWVGVAKGLNIYCESNEVIREVHKVKHHQISETYSLGVLESITGQHLELILIRNMGDIFYVASLIPLEPRYFVPMSCEHCLEYKISFDSSPFLTFGFESFDGDYFISEEVVLASSYFEAKFQLSGNREFYEQYTYFSWWMILLIAGIVASWVTYVASLWFNHAQSIHNQIIQGIKRSEFIPFYQPIVDSRNQKVIGAEVLMRWQRQDGSLMPPNQFIPYAEANGLIVHMTKGLLGHVFNDVKQLASKRDALFFSVNIVPEHLDNDDLYQMLKGVVESGELQQHSISLEITERLPIKDLVAARKMLDKFYAIGIDLKLDDAGTGYGGFSYVQHLGISTLKIDKMFVDTIGRQDNFNTKTIEAIISFAQKSNLNMIAEGVEDDKQVAYLSEQGVYFIQGYVYSKPLPAKQFFH